MVRNKKPRRLTPIITKKKIKTCITIVRLLFFRTICIEKYYTTKKYNNT